METRSDERVEIREKILSSLGKNPHGLLHISPRVGKTSIVISLIRRDMPGSVLWVTPFSYLAKKGIKEEFEKWDSLENYNQQVRTCTYSSLHKIQEYFDWIVLDEIQSVTPANIVNLFNKTLTYNNIIGMTGTPSKDMIKNFIYRQLCLPVLYTLDIDSAVGENLISNYDITVYKIPLSKEKIEGKNFSEYSFYNILNDKCSISNMCTLSDFEKKQRLLYRMRFIANSSSKEIFGKSLFDSLMGRKIIFCSSIKQAQKLCRYSYHSKSSSDSDLFRFLSNDIQEISLVRAGAIGFTYEDIDHIVIIQADSNTNGLTLQKICRGLLKSDKTTHIHIICLSGTQDEVWVSKSLSGLNQNKIFYKILPCI